VVPVHKAVRTSTNKGNSNKSGLQEDSQYEGEAADSEDEYKDFIRVDVHMLEAYEFQSHPSQGKALRVYQYKKGSRAQMSSSNEKKDET
jgi:hypothetical protein